MASAMVTHTHQEGIAGAIAVAVAAGLAAEANDLQLASGIPGARKVAIARTAHVPSLERPEEFDRLVVAFLRAS